MDNLNEQFSQIYDQYIDKIYRFVYLKVGWQEIAEDITSKVFTKGWEAFKALNSGIKNPGAFLYQIARNAVVDYYRAKDRSKTSSFDDGPEITDPGTNAQDQAILSADVTAVKKAIQKLKKEHQDIIIWHYLEDMTIPEIAQLMGKPEGTVRVMLHRGLKDLRDVTNL
jgi:RNA polymerase sigma-70 factor (ECF subfamily)